MQTRDHVQAARDFLTAAEGDFAVGAHLQGSTKLWEAASLAMTAVAKQRNWPYSSRRELKNAARLLADETSDMALIAGFAAAEKFHANSSYDFMEDFELDADRPVVNDFVERLLVLAA